MHSFNVFTSTKSLAVIPQAAKPPLQQQNFKWKTFTQNDFNNVLNSCTPQQKKKTSSVESKQKLKNTPRSLSELHKATLETKIMLKERMVSPERKPDKKIHFNPV